MKPSWSHIIPTQPHCTAHIINDFDAEYFWHLKREDVSNRTRFQWHSESSSWAMQIVCIFSDMSNYNSVSTCQHSVTLSLSSFNPAVIKLSIWQRISKYRHISILECCLCAELTLRSCLPKSVWLMRSALTRQRTMLYNSLFRKTHF